MTARNASARRASHAGSPHARGFTLVELMVALSGGLFLSVIVFALARDASRFYQRETRLASATLAGITGFERLKADIQRASYLCTPNIQDDPLVRPLPGSPGIANLAGIRITPNTPNLQGNPAFKANDTAGQPLEPDQIDLAGSYEATDEFPGTVSISGLVVTLGGNSPSLARLGFLSTTDATTQQNLIGRVFAVGRILRFVEIGSHYQSYGVIASVVVVSGIPQITLSTPLNGVNGFGSGSSVNVVNRVRYQVMSIPATDEDWAPMFAASQGAPGETDRTELVRYELDAADQIIEGTTDVVAEYAVDLEFGVTGQTTAGGTLAYAASSVDDDETTFNGFFSATGTPQWVRSVRARMSVRSREANREANITGPGGGRIYRFRLGDGLGWARVRTFQADIPLPESGDGHMVKRRTSTSHANERGATLFVVVLAITLLTGIGLYTVHSAGLVAQASGNGRQALQTEHLAQLGALATMSKLVEIPATLTNAQIEWRTKTNDEQCNATRGVDATTQGVPFCLELKSDATDFPLTGNVPLVAADSFGMAIDPDTNAAPITGIFHTETTEVDQAGPVAGSSVGSASTGPKVIYVQAKITSIGQLLPAAAFGNAACVENMMQVSGQHITRAHVIVGPISQ